MNRPSIITASLLAAASSHGVILSGGDGTQNTTAPIGGQGWDYVGRITGSAPSGVTYIDNDWFITAYHIQVLDSPTGVLLGGSSYSIDAGSWTRLTNSVGGDADLAMFRVTTDVALPGLSIAAASLSNGTGLTMIGNGRNRQIGETQWNVNTAPDPWTWVEVGSGGNAAGYKWDAGSTKRWGTNTKEASAGLINDGFGITDMFYTDFDSTPDEAQGATFDSGGGVFVDNGGDWELAGLMLTTVQFSGQPASTAVYGDLTYSADLAFYADQINTTTAIPEPSVLAFGFIVPIAFYARRIFCI